MSFTGCKLSDAVRQAELLGCAVRRAWLEDGEAHVSVVFEQPQADGVARTILEGAISFTADSRT
jgi:hypothetical protein